MMKPDIFERRLRTFLLLLGGMAMIVTLIELWLQNHLQSPLQFIPWGLCGLGLVTLLAALIRPSKATFITLRVAMLVVALGGTIGILIHLNENFEFQKEIHPNVAALDSFWVAFKGAAPLLAPGSLIFAALVAIAATYHHPVLEKPRLMGQETRV